MKVIPHDITVVENAAIDLEVLAQLVEDLEKKGSPLRLTSSDDIRRRVDHLRALAKRMSGG